MKPSALCKRLGMTRGELARALGVTERTVARWDDGTSPQGVAAEVFRGIELAIGEGVDPSRIGNALRSGIGTLLRLGFTRGGLLT